LRRENLATETLEADPTNAALPAMEILEAVLMIVVLPVMETLADDLTNVVLPVMETLVAVEILVTAELSSTLTKG